MQSLNVIIRKNDVESIRQLVNAGHGEIIPAQTGILVPNELLNGSKIERLIKAGFKIAEIGTTYTVINP